MLHACTQHRYFLKRDCFLLRLKLFPYKLTRYRSVGTERAESSKYLLCQLSFEPRTANGTASFFLAEYVTRGVELTVDRSPALVALQ